MSRFYQCSGFNFNDFDLLVENEYIYAAYVKKIPFPKELKDAKQPNRFGIAKSNDGINWEEVGDIILPEPGGWDESLWAGCISKQGNDYVIYYCGVKVKERQSSCKIGKAYSTDLVNWKKDPANPVLIFDTNNKFYSDEPNLSFRDPFHLEYEGKNYIIFCGKDKNQPEHKQGCVGMVEEAAPNKFVYMPPIFSPGIYFDGLECPALYKLGEHWYLLYGVDGENREKAFRYAMADSPFGPFTAKFSDNQLLSSKNYTCRIAKFKGKHLLYNWFRDFPDGIVRERLAPPKEVHILDDGRISLSELDTEVPTTPEVQKIDSTLTIV